MLTQKLKEKISLFRAKQRGTNDQNHQDSIRIPRRSIWTVLFWIGLSALAGAFAVYMAIGWYLDNCLYTCSKVCSAIEGSPPWILLSTVAAAFPALVTWYWRKKDKNDDIVNKQIENQIADENQLAERYRNATSKLGEDSLAPKLGAIFELELLAERAPHYVFLIIKLFCACIRQKSPTTNLAPERKAEVQAMLDALGKLKRDSEERFYYNLEGSNLNGVRLRGNFNNTIFKRASLKNIESTSAKLNHCDFRTAILTGSKMFFADFHGSEFADSKLDGVNFYGASFKNAYITANYARVDLIPEDMNGPNMKGANLGSTHLEGVDLRTVTGLTEESFQMAIFDDKTQFPNELDKDEIVRQQELYKQGKQEEQQTDKGVVNMIRVGQKAPDFQAPAYYKGDFTSIKLSDYRGKWVDLCFYPGDFTFV